MINYLKATPLIANAWEPPPGISIGRQQMRCTTLGTGAGKSH
jgi:hypothetical protein